MSTDRNEHTLIKKINNLVKKRRSALGQVPGTLIHVGERKVQKVKLTVIDFDEKNYTEEVIGSVEQCYPYISRPTVTWLNIDGLHDTVIFQELGEHFNIHPLVLEDILTTDQRPKFEDLDNYLLIVVKMISYNERDDRIEQEQVSLLLGPSFVISVQEKEGDVFNVVRDRIKKGKGRIRKLGADYLAYSLIDAIVDNYFIVMEKLGERLELLEDELLENPTASTSQLLHVLKRELIYLRRSVWPLREIVGALERGDSRLVNKTTIIFLRDLYDHTIQVIDTVEIYRETIAGILDAYLSSLSNRMNSTMKVLTIIATIFIPLTFIAGIYGMNFNYMPELHWRWSYPVVWGVMVCIGIFMVVFFKRKKWL